MLFRYIVHFLGRQRQKRIGKRENENTSNKKMEEDILKPCCDLCCLEQIPMTLFEETRKSFWRLITTKQNQAIQSHMATIGKDKDGNQLCILGGYMLCSRAWMIIHGVSKSRYVIHLGTVSNK